MRTQVVEVASGLKLDREMFDAARHAAETLVSEYAHRLTWTYFTSRASWRLIPDPQQPDLPFFKAELVLVNEPPWQLTVKYNYWLAADLRRDGKPIPHNHPWEVFYAHILLGGYCESRYTKTSGGGIEEQFGFYIPGSVNEMPKNVYHEVTKILVPGTLTVMVCGPGVKDDWGYLETESGLYIPNKEISFYSEFKRLVRERNPK